MINQVLYRHLVRIFGEVEIVNENEPILFEKRIGYDAQVRMYKSQSGEQYKMNCPFCGDSRGRLYISHAWGMDKDNKFPTSKLVVCQNEHCEQTPYVRQLDVAARCSNPKQWLEYRLKNKYTSPLPTLITNLPAAIKTKRLPFPGRNWSTAVNELDSGHPARLYLESRDMDVDILFNTYRVVYTHTYPVQENGKDYSWLEGRLFIPNFVEGRIDGWQARLISGEAKLKYFNCPAWKKSEAVYGAASARRFEGALLQEGVTDCWRVGAPAICGYGKSLSAAQCRIISDSWGCVGIMYDPDADDDKVRSAHKAIKALGRRVNKVFRVELPDGRDPADCSHDEVWKYIERSATAAGVALDKFTNMVV